MWNNGVHLHLNLGFSWADILHKEDFAYTSPTIVIPALLLRVCTAAPTADVL